MQDRKVKDQNAQHGGSEGPLDQTNTTTWLKSYYSIDIMRLRVNTNLCFIVIQKQRHATKNKAILECGPIPNVMAALANTGGARRPLSNASVCLTPNAGVPCSNAANTRNPLKLPGVP